MPSNEAARVRKLLHNLFCGMRLDVNASQIEVNALPEEELLDFQSRIEVHKDDTPVALLVSSFGFKGYNIPKQTYDRNNLQWVCSLRDGELFGVGSARDRKAAYQIAAANLIIHYIEDGRVSMFFLPQNKYKALEIMKQKRAQYEEKFSIVEKNPRSLLSEFAQFYKLPPPVYQCQPLDGSKEFKCQLLFDDIVTIGHGPSHQEAKHIAGIRMYDMMCNEGKIEKYLQEQASAANRRDKKRAWFRTQAAKKNEMNIF